MALHNLKITVINGGRAKTGDSFIQKGSKTPANDKLNNVNNDVEGGTGKGVLGIVSFSKDYAVDIAKNLVKHEFNYFVSDIGRRTGDSNFQDRVNRQIEVCRDVGGILGGAISGATTGASLGPVGVAIGFAFGAIASGLNVHYKYKERERAYQHTIFQENTSQAYNLARANFHALSGRKR